MMHGRRRWVCTALLVGAFVTMAHRGAPAQEVPLGWDATQYFQYNIENVIVVAQPTMTTPGTVKVIFSVTDPKNGNAPWDITTVGPFKCGATLVCPSPGPAPSLNIDLGWNTIESVNTGNRFSLSSVAASGSTPLPAGTTALRTVGGAAFPIRINALTTAAHACADMVQCPGVPLITGRFWVSSLLPPQAIGGVNTGVVGTAVVGMEGHPVWPATGTATFNVPVKSVVKTFAITDPVAVPRRQVVDFDTKCSKCHDGQLHDGREIPRLALHGGNRNEEPKLCVICHNPNQTDILYRTAASPPSTDPLITSTFKGVAPEVSVDFKRMPHSIHAGGFRGPYRVVGFNGTVVDFSAVRFPAKLSNCLNCHVEINGKGTFELPLAAGVLGSTVKTGSTIGTTVDKVIDVDPTNNLRITPIASVCSSCHDKSEVRSHMISKGARFGVLQADIDSAVASGRGEQCVNCHGPGKDKDVRKVHEIGAEEHEEEHDD